MVFDEPIEVESAVFVPVKVRQELQALLKSCTKITVSENSGTKQRKVNGLALNTKSGQYPQESVEEIAEAVTRIMHSTWAAQETEDPDPDVGLPPVEFTVVCEHWLATGGAKKKRVRNQFLYVYHADSEDDFEEITQSSELAAIGQLLEHYKSLTGMQMAQLNEAHERIIRNSEHQTASANAGAEMLREAIPMFLGGMQASLNAKYMEYNVRKTDIDAANSGKTLETVMASVAPMLPILGMQILSKMGVDPAMAAGMVGMFTGGAQPPGAATPAAEAPDPSASSYAYTQPAAEPDDLEPGAEAPTKHPLALLGEAFGGSLKVAQHRKINALLTKKQRSLFDDLFCATTDDEAYAAYQAVMKGAMDKLAGLQQLLDPTQVQCLQMFMRAATAHAAKAKG